MASKAKRVNTKNGADALAMSPNVRAMRDDETTKRRRTRETNERVESNLMIDDADDDD